MPGQHRLGHRVLQGAPVLRVAPRLKSPPYLVLEGGQGVELTHRLGQLVVQRGEDLLLHLAHLDRGHSRLAAQGLVPVIVGKAHVRGALTARGEANDGFLDLAHHRAGADDEAIARLRHRLHALGGESVVHDYEVLDVGRAFNRAEFRVLLAQVLQGLVDLTLLEWLGLVFHGQAGVLTEGDGRLDLYERLELERRALLEAHFLQVGLLHGPEFRLLESLAIDVGDEVPGNFLADVVGEVELDHAPRHLPLRKPGSLASFWTRVKAFSHALLTTSGASSTCSRRLQAPSSSTATFIPAPG